MTNNRTNEANLVLTGNVDLARTKVITMKAYESVDISEAEFIIDDEPWCQCLGYSHCGPVYGASGVKKVEVLTRFLQLINAEKIILPDDIARRHLNAIGKNPHIKEVIVPDSCKLFAMKDGDVYNKRITKLIFKRKK